MPIVIPKEDHLTGIVLAKQETCQTRMILAVREIGEKKIIRASPHIFNTELQMEETLKAVKSL